MSGEKKLMIVLVFGPIVLGFGGCAFCVSVGSVSQVTSVSPGFVMLGMVILVALLVTLVLAVMSALRGGKRRGLRARWGPQVGDALANGQMWVGMTSHMLLDGIGPPGASDRQVGPAGMREVWRYSDKRGNLIVTLDNGVVVGWHDLT